MLTQKKISLSWFSHLLSQNRKLYTTPVSALSFCTLIPVFFSASSIPEKVISWFHSKIGNALKWFREWSLLSQTLVQSFISFMILGKLLNLSKLVWDNVNNALNNASQIVKYWLLYSFWNLIFLKEGFPLPHSLCLGQSILSVSTNW